jgi:hypothetical protein
MTTLTAGTQYRKERSERCGRSGRITPCKLECHTRDSPLPAHVFSNRLKHDVPPHPFPELSPPLQPHSKNRRLDYDGSPPMSEQRRLVLRRCTRGGAIGGVSSRAILGWGVAEQRRFLRATSTRARVESVGGETKNPDDRSITRPASLKCPDHGYNSLHQIVVCTRRVMTGWGHTSASSKPARHALFSQLPSVSTMDEKSQRRRDGALSLLNVAIEAMNLAKEVSSATPAKAVFGSVSAILVMIRVGLLLVRPSKLQANAYRTP